MLTYKKTIPQKVPEKYKKYIYKIYNKKSVSINRLNYSYIIVLKI